MPHPRLACALAALAAATATAAPVPKHLMPKEEPLLFPTRVGDRHVSVLNGADVVCVVTRVEKVADGVKVTQEFEEAGGQRTPDMVVIASAKGLQVVEYAGRKLDRPGWWAKLPAVPGDEHPNPLGGSPYRTVGWEEVAVPAGKFRALRVDRDDGPGGTTSYWYAPGVGCVKWADANRSRELKSFTPAK